eukprot:m.354612 g.354612  ORF g.354612 m.354612 type:complete len:148 (+) comp55934_c0_seq8:1447-1890(+)
MRGELQLVVLVENLEQWTNILAVGHVHEASGPPPAQERGKTIYQADPKRIQRIPHPGSREERYSISSAPRDSRRCIWKMGSAMNCRMRGFVYLSLLGGASSVLRGRAVASMRTQGLASASVWWRDQSGRTTISCWRMGAAACARRAI